MYICMHVLEFHIVCWSKIHDPQHCAALWPICLVQVVYWCSALVMIIFFKVMSILGKTPSQTQRRRKLVKQCLQSPFRNNPKQHLRMVHRSFPEQATSNHQTCRACFTVLFLVAKPSNVSTPSTFPALSMAEDETLHGDLSGHPLCFASRASWQYWGIPGYPTNGHVNMETDSEPLNLAVFPLNRQMCG